MFICRTVQGQSLPPSPHQIVYHAVASYYSLGHMQSQAQYTVYITMSVGCPVVAKMFR